MIIVVSLLYGNSVVDFVELRELRPFLSGYYAVSVTIKLRSSVRILARARAYAAKPLDTRNNKITAGKRSRAIRSARSDEGRICKMEFAIFRQRAVESVMLFASSPLIIPQIRNFLPCHGSSFLPLQLFAPILAWFLNPRIARKSRVSM